MMLPNTFLFISGAEIIFILFIVVLVFGADKLPEIARGMGKGMRILKDTTNDIKHEITKTADKNGMNTDLLGDVKKGVDGIKDDIEDFTGSIRRKL